MKAVIKWCNEGGNLSVKAYAILGVAGGSFFGAIIHYVW